MASPIELNKLQSHLWESANILRGPVDAADFKTYIFPLLFFKRLCDVYDEEIAAALRESDGEMTYALFPEQHRFQVPDDCHWKEVRARSANIGHALQQAMRGIEQANPDTLLGIFGDAQWTNKDRLSDALLKDLIEHFSSLSLGNENCRADVLGQAYEYLIKKFADLTNKKAGEFYTPRPVVDLMVRILDPKEGETIYDPACGTGGMLLGALNFVTDHGGDEHLMLGKLHGQEKNLTTSAIARMNLFLHGNEDFSIERGDTLRQPMFHSGDGLAVFDRVIANPPFSLEKWGDEVWINDPYGRNFAGLPPTKSGDFAWVQHMIRSMAPKTGRMAVVLPHGVLFRAAKEGAIRRNLLEADNLEAVIGLGANLFYGASLAACILVFRETKPEDRRQKVLFIDASREFKTGRAQNELLPEHVENIHRWYGEYRDVEGVCRVVSLDEIRSNDFNLNIPRYVEPVIEEETITVDEAIVSLKESLNAAYVAEDHLTQLLKRANIGVSGVPGKEGDSGYRYEQGREETPGVSVAAEASPRYGDETTRKVEERYPPRPHAGRDQDAERVDVLPIREAPGQTTNPSFGISQAELESYLWGAATLLRGTIDAGDYKQFIFTLLFFKRLCDVYDEERANALEESGGDEGYAELPEQHRFQIPPEAHWSAVRAKVTNVGKAIQDALRGIEKANPDTLPGVFGDAGWTNKNRLPDHTLRELIEHFSSRTLSLANLPEDELGTGYEFLIKKFADDSGHTAAEFYTNRTVVHLMTEMLEPKPGEAIYDPTCGSAGMLLSAVAHLKRRGREWRNVGLYGQERNLLTSAIGRMNLFLHGIEDFKVIRGDTLADPKFVEGDGLRRFDVILANPPYSIKQWDRAAWASDPWGRNVYGTPPQGRADYAFLQHIVASMKPGTGRSAILFPHGVLFRNEEKAMREKLVADDVVECVLGLGPNLFYNSPMEACVVVCRTDKPKERRGKIQFINAVAEVTRERAQSFLTDGHIRRMVDTYHGFEDISGFARVATTDEVLERGGDLSIPLYVRAENGRANESGDGASLNQVLAEWRRSSQMLRESMSGLFDVLDDKDREEQMPKLKPPVQPAFKRAVLAAEVVSALHREPTFGSVKHEKVVFLCEKHLGLDEELEHHHLRQAAGPYDPGARRSIENNFRKLKWFDVVRKGGRITYSPGEKFGAHSRYFGRYFVDARDEIEWIVELLRPLNSARCEIIATLYSVWSDYLDQGISPTDDKIVDDSLDWHEKKKRFSREQWLQNVKWMKNNGLVPTEKQLKALR